MKASQHQSVDQRYDFGKSLRKKAPRTSHAEWSPDAGRPDLISLFEEQNASRLDWLVPERHARMMSSEFAFYRAGAAIMAADLAATPVSGLLVQACGDAHLANFGLYASPERKLVFDINDFDETLAGPWEWDLKRLVASFTIAARHNELRNKGTRTATQRVVRSYREAMNNFSRMRAIDVWYAIIHEEEFLASAEQKSTRKRAKKVIAKAKTKDSLQVFDRLSEEVDGQIRLRSDPPLLVPLRDLGEKCESIDEQVCQASFEAYVKSMSPECKVLLRNYRPVDIGIKVVGVGSVGTRCWILLLEGRDRCDPLFLQMKEATPSALAGYLSPNSWESEGRRVVEGQRLMQTANDIFLGWTHHPDTGHDYYWRQLRDWKGAVDVEGLDATDLNNYAQLCGWTLAHAHARSGDPVAIAGYLGSGETFDRALVEFAERYAEQNQRDYETFMKAVTLGRLETTAETT